MSRHFYTVGEWWRYWFGEPERTNRPITARDKVYMICFLLLTCWMIVAGIAYGTYRLIAGL